ncbi:hypothetical protein K0M31_003310 [Melipona bicolor]|uniref:Uncharacterized protein n=1 Tax=Melipona bicolor TaxID=60889 RepID=A0AA40FYS3_9HYME|nr:hypothetical protein K0M31_003310 [Melipona bicolor]
MTEENKLMTCTVIYQYLNVLCEYSSFLNPLIQHYRFGVITARHNNKSLAKDHTRGHELVSNVRNAILQNCHIFQLVGTSICEGIYEASLKKLRADRFDRPRRRSSRLYNTFATRAEPVISLNSHLSGAESRVSKIIQHLVGWLSATLNREKILLAPETKDPVWPWWFIPIRVRGNNAAKGRSKGGRRGKGEIPWCRPGWCVRLATMDRGVVTKGGTQ